ncbi:ribosome-associated translation inhibitor RaiA [Pueribacillus theae]|uniref:Ribosome hibernation promoting factor n=1 Tax=Pueribacillus theae TaxID=2171751 RepID=A0A2U1JQT8_9BACI|nr:ribosome-associated translation inhibitor RaiA [Pueribacillus theae]PWA07521.1 ribosome-associated translation inhibitor RaiA [Pueribacillus theae]
MKFEIRGENITVTDALNDYIKKKLGKIERYFDSEINADVHVRMKVYNSKQTIEVTIPMKGLLLRAEESDQDMYAAIDQVAEKLERQIRKHKTKINRKFRNEGSIKNLFAEAPADKREDAAFEIVRKKSFHLKPMNVEEAILQMNMLGHSFFIFSNAETNDTNVVYKRKDGKYALIETE